MNSFSPFVVEFLQDQTKRYSVGPKREYAVACVKCLIDHDGGDLQSVDIPSGLDDYAPNDIKKTVMWWVRLAHEEETRMERLRKMVVALDADERRRNRQSKKTGNVASTLVNVVE